MDKVLTYAIVVINLIFSVVGQLFIKKGVDQVGGFVPEKWFSFFVASFTNPLILLGESLYLIGAFLWLVVLTKINLSVAYPMLSLGYVFILIFSAWWLHEPVTWVNTAGVMLICAGVVMVMR
ncbi:hypothetical protein AUK40_04770 [Candidatus Wirthbacteria bacterium CG2_30_54_11]|uniref:EamA domain-containing protein n=1 Tax=Candidatus Wirthbacteria bacterium CG2_30_54_11 TaxID=1817892 RepID=A0A1J5IQG3_9BACT|nr:MAG: hypothetical protein AUK40_04770 [Candidatus Wirthbacteria bacterium CG2_30_54_11]